MPIRNMGTLLENIVIVEAMRILARGRNDAATVDVLNSFAMPPLSGWCAHRTDYGFSSTQLNTVQAGPQPVPHDSYQAILWSCLQLPPGEPGTQGPNGALLCGLLAQLISRPIRLWLNDIRHGHYGNALPGLAAINAMVQRVQGLSKAPQNDVVVCDIAWPDCQVHLRDTLALWQNESCGRLGFLDPMRYRISSASAGETDSESHRAWLRLLAEAVTCPVVSVQFTGHSDWPTLRPEIRHMHSDGHEAGYTHTLVAHHSYYHAVCSIRSPQGLDAGRTIAADLSRSLESAWSSWFATIGRRSDDLAIEVLEGAG